MCVEVKSIVMRMKINVRKLWWWWIGLVWLLRKRKKKKKMRVLVSEFENVVGEKDWKVLVLFDVIIVCLIG